MKSQIDACCMARTTVIAATACVMIGCGKAETESPVGALASGTPTTRYVHEYWLDQAERRTAQWDSAYAYCSEYWQHEDGSKPNCGHVYTAHFYRAGADAQKRKASGTPDSTGRRP